jgi:hypothetical protein
MFTPIETTIGALLLHLATTTLLFDDGIILGVSGLLRQLFNDPKHAASSPALWFVVGTAIATSLVLAVAPEIIPAYPDPDANFLKVVGSGLLTGWGTKVSVRV